MIERHGTGMVPMNHETDDLQSGSPVSRLRQAGCSVWSFALPVSG